MAMDPRHTQEAMKFRDVLSASGPESGERLTSRQGHLKGLIKPGKGVYYMGEAFALTVGAFLLTVELSCLQSIEIYSHARSHRKQQGFRVAPLQKEIAPKFFEFQKRIEKKKHPETFPKIFKPCSAA